MSTVYKRRYSTEYIPPILIGESVEELRAEMQKELENLATVIQSVQDIDLIPLGKEPKRFGEGSVKFFEAGIAVTGIGSTQKGLHVFESNSWRKL